MGAWRNSRYGLILTLLALAQGAWGWQIDSGPRHTLMIELFTSEGCSSCPPAEALLNRFADNPGLWRSFIPLAFHVDYWDYLGWRDRYALPANAVRQRRYVALGHVHGVYTPAFLVNGRGWRPGWRGSEPSVEDAPAGRLTAMAKGDGVQLHYAGAGAVSGPLVAHLVLLGMGLSTDIGAGENSGRHAVHDFVVLGHRERAGEGPSWQLPLPSDLPVQAPRQALVVWLSRPGDPTPVQAAGGFLPVSDQ